MSTPQAAAVRDLAPGDKQPDPHPACQGLDPEIFHGPADSPEGRLALHPWEWAAQEVCWSCPVEAACLAEALRWPAEDQWGVIGGMTAGQRKAALRSLRPQPTRRLADTRGLDELTVDHLATGRQVPGASREEIAQATVRLHAQGVALSVISSRLDVHERTVSLWVAQAAAGQPLTAGRQLRRTA